VRTPSLFEAWVVSWLIAVAAIVVLGLVSR